MNRWLKMLLIVYVIAVTLILIGSILQAWNWWDEFGLRGSIPLGRGGTVSSGEARLDLWQAADLWRTRWNCCLGRTL